MKRTILRPLLAGTALFSILATFGCASAQPSESLKIGVEGPLTGDQALTGQGMLNGALLAATEINAAGGVDGRQIEIVPIDDMADPETGVAAANAAIEAGLDAVVGPYNSGVGIETLPLYESAGIVPVRLTSNSKTNSMGFTLQPMDYQIAPVATTGLTQWLSAQTVAIIFDTTAEYTSSIAQSLQAELEAAGATVSAAIPITPGESDVAAAVSEASQSGADVIYGATYFPEGALIAKAISEQQIPQLCVLDYASDDPGYIVNSGSLDVAQRCSLVGVPTPSDFVDGEEFIADYEAEFGEAPGTWSPYTYDSVRMIAAAIDQTGGTDADALTDFYNGVSEWPGVTGSVTIDPANGNREPATVVFLRVTNDGEFRVDSDWASAVGAPF